MIRTVFLVPTQDNDGKPFTRTDWHELEQKLFQFGGWSKTGPVEGAWSDGNKVYRDRSRQYHVALASWTQLPEWLEVIRWTRTHFRQEALYIEVAGIPEIIGE